ncbi:outer membrane lipoprotein carrier protein LolA [Corticibacter populi]|uniref:Outer-membrane lipoprotein carrier protein n=1 Tax=Corticibacter populi TaxID=1550736 RepID=A0A3M6R062_9BURK|nr:outer membrane lipoprotein chaperone LolA [Corticibacter populi]RMX08638.1 outer membrane lipoprotein carrier protein LolA [Corticibacter populi]RZS35970.1 outer membrane lipoprotein carrier protein [Corticibacter populi]
MKKSIAMLALSLASSLAMADGLQALDAFLQNVRSGQSSFTQTVTAPERDGQPGRVSRSSGTFAFERPGKFRFDYLKPFPQQIVGDGTTLWVYDEDLNQATSRPQQQALDSTPAAILSSATSRASLERDFTLQSGPAADGLQWVVATPKATDGQLRSVRIGFQGEHLAALDIEDSFSQHSALRFENFEPNAPVDAAQFRFTPPADADVIHDAAQ